MFRRSFTQNELQLHQLNNKQLPLQIYFATLTHDNQVKSVHYLVKHETILPSQKDYCRPILADFGNYQFSIGINDKGEDIKIKPLDSILFEAVKPFQSQYKKPIKKNTKTLLQKAAILNGTDITDNDDPFEKKYHQMVIPFPPIYR